MHVIKKYTNPIDRNNNVGQSYSFYSEVNYVFWIEGIPQVKVYLSHADTFILHSR